MLSESLLAFVPSNALLYEEKSPCGNIWIDEGTQLMSQNCSGLEKNMRVLVIVSETYEGSKQLFCPPN